MCEKLATEAPSDEDLAVGYLRALCASILDEETSHMAGAREAAVVDLGLSTEFGAG